jgi:hypothetical protein
VLSFPPRPHYPRRKGIWYPLNTRTDRTRPAFGCSGDEKNSSLAGNRTLVFQPIANHYDNPTSNYRRILFKCPEEEEWGWRGDGRTVMKSILTALYDSAVSTSTAYLQEHKLWSWDRPGTGLTWVRTEGRILE